MSIVAEPSDTHAPAMQWMTRLGVAAAAIQCFVVGRILGGQAFTDLGQTVAECALWALLHITCLLVGMAWFFARSNIHLRRMAISFKRKRRRLRNHLRRRWADQRRRRNSHWEEDLLFWLVLLSACAAMMLVPYLPFILLIAACVIFIIWLVTLWLYKNAPDNPVGAIRASALLGFFMGYTA